MLENWSILKKLTDAYGLPGYEGDVRKIIKEEIEGYVDSIHIDNLGNLIAVKNQNAKGRHIALSAHMDEAGIVVTSINNDGLLLFASWGVDPRALIAQTVKVGQNKIQGVIGSKPVHLQAAADRDKAHTIKQLYVDIGCTSKSEAEKLVSLGDYIGFDSEYTEFGKDMNKIKAKALDDRAGCAILIRALQSDYTGKLTAIFNVQEEVGLRGSRVSANQVFADLVLNVEGTLCLDVCDVPEHNRVTEQGKGVAISIIDAYSIYLKKYIDEITDTAKDKNISYQFRKTKAGGTDSANFHIAHGGTPVVGVAVPCRYIHSSVSILDKRDYESAFALISAFLEKQQL